MLVTQQVQYAQASASGVIDNAPGEFYGIVVVASTTAIIQIYDNASAASGTLIYDSVTAVSAGQVIHFGGAGIKSKNGLYLNIVSGTGTFNILYV
jgi:hypothetical protein